MVVVLALLAGPFLSMVDSSIVNVAVPDIARSLTAPLSSVQWTVSGYLLSLSSGLAVTAWLAKRFGNRRVYVAGLAGFSAASALCALAPSIQLLVAARALQGLLGAPLIPIAMGILTGGSTSLAASDGRSRGVSPAMVAMGMLLFAGPALGPTLGGVLIRSWGWPSIFLVNLPFGLLGLLGALRLDPRLSPSDPSARFDPIGTVVLAAGLALALYGAGQGPTAGWLAGGVWPFWSLGGLLVAAYVGWAVRSRHPALNVRLLADTQTAVAIVLAAVISVVSFAALFLLPVFLQTVQGYSALDAGLALLPQGLVMGAGTVLGQAVARSGRLRLAAVGGTSALTLTTAALLMVGAGTPIWVTAAILCGRGLAFGLVTQPLLVTMMARLSGGDVADGSTLFNVAQRIAASFGIGLLATLFEQRLVSRISSVLGTVPGAHPVLHGPPSGIAPGLREALVGAAVGGFHDVVWILVAVSAAGILLAFGVRSPPR